MPARFVVAGSPRTGSSLVLSTLGLHPQLRAFGELFHFRLAEREGAGEHGTDFYRDESEDAVAFLDRSVWGAATAAKPVVGFKLFACHTRSPGTRGLFARLHEHVPDLRVIHPYRANYLDAWVSLERALQSDVWLQPAGREIAAGRPIRPLAVDPGALEAFFEDMEATDRLVRTFHHPGLYLRVDYDELTHRYDATVAEMWRFLQVPAFHVQAPLAKQNRRPHRELLLNYDELERYFSATRFAGFFRQDRVQ